MTTNLLKALIAMHSEMSLTKLLRMAIALFEIPVSGWTCKSGKGFSMDICTDKFLFLTPVTDTDYR